MNEVYDDLKNALEVWFDEGIEIEEVVAALHVFTIQCETTMRLKLTTDLMKDEDDAE
jgi:hypothetical protein